MLSWRWRVVLQVVLAGLVAGAFVILASEASTATVTGGCSVTGTTASGGSTDLTTTAIWHLHSDDVVSGTATYPTQTYVHAYVLLFGVPVTVYNSSGSSSSGNAGPFKVSDYSRYTRVFAVGGYSDTCTGAVLIVVDDQSPFTNLAGIVGLVLLGLGLIGLLFLLFTGSGSAGCGSWFFGVLFGLLLGLGAAIVAAEAGVIDPRSVVGLVAIGVGVVLGILAPVLRGRMVRAGP